MSLRKEKIQEPSVEARSCDFSRACAEKPWGGISEVKLPYGFFTLLFVPGEYERKEKGR